jgi:hypothetical protein
LFFVHAAANVNKKNIYNHTYSGLALLKIYWDELVVFLTSRDFEIAKSSKIHGNPWSE